MRASYSVGLIGICWVSFVTNLAAESALLSLRNNPFSQPEILNAPPPPPPVVSKVVVPAEEIELALSATMVSENVPMVVVDGELLAVGETIAGLKLIEVLPGKAIFTRGGKRYSFMIINEQPK
ncbi:MAG: general secretion pathway protein GspB [Gammaproteobacteria bacterium]|nr:general secretion pathway protein GspB [Gammaproteobacteria bacterium]